MIEPHPRTPIYRLGWYRELAPPPDLRAFADVLWSYGRPARGTEPIPGDGHRILPDPGLSVCFLCRRDERGVPAEPSLVVIGPVRTIRFFNPEPGLHLEAVKLRPEWSRDLLEVDPGEQTDAISELCSIRPPGPMRLLDRLARTRTTEEALTLLVGWIRVLRDGFRASREATLAHQGLERIRQRREATLAFDALARHLGASERHLRRVIGETTSFSPKEHHRILRLNRAVPAAERAVRPDWSLLAAETGYYDQSHLIREFRSLAGRSPSELLVERRIQDVVIGEASARRTR